MSDDDSIAASDRAEARYAARNPLPEHRFCPPDCRCRECVLAELDDMERPA